jgi:hypothetical protein
MTLDYGGWRKLVDQDPANQPFDDKLVTKLLDGPALQPLYPSPSPSLAPAPTRSLDDWGSA